jgi:aconitate decarboxylase
MSSDDDAATPEARLAAFAAELTYEDIPVGTRDRVVALVLDAVACGLLGREAEDRPAIESTARRLGGDGSSPVIGGSSTSMVGATLLNGFQITATTICDVHRPTLCHVTPEVVPPALAVGAEAGVDGPAFLAAVAAGMETTVRVGLALDYPRFRARGWHTPGVAGPFGGAVAASRLLGLDARAIRHALGHAGGQAGGTFAALGSAGIKVHQARGGVSGLLAALLAAAGISGAPAVLTAPDGGLLRSMGEGGRPRALTEDLGTRWELEGISLRRWPAASGLQAEISALLDLAGTEHLEVGAIAEVTVHLSEATFDMFGRREPDDQLSAMQSPGYIAAAVLHDCSFWMAQLGPERIGDPALLRFMRDRVRVELDAGLPDGGARVAVRLANGRRLERCVPIPPGEPAAPLDRAQLVDKLRLTAASAGLADRADTILEAIDNLAGGGPVRALASAMAGR